MNLKKIVAFFVLSILFISTNFAFAENEDLEIGEGKNVKLNFRGNNGWYSDWYNDNLVYKTVNIGAGTKIVLDSEWQYVLVSSEVSTQPQLENRDYIKQGSTETYTAQDQIYIATYTYRRDENIATLAVNNNGGKIILNAGSELSIRNQYSLVSSTQDVSLEYMSVDEDISLKTGHYSNEDNICTYEAKDGEKTEFYFNKALKPEPVNIFTGEIIFESGDSPTTLTFQKISEKESEDYIFPSGTYEKIISGTEEEGYVKNRNIASDVTDGSPSEKENIVRMVNNFQINSNSAVFNVVGFGEEEGKEWSESCRQVALGKTNLSSLNGDGRIVKKGEGTLNLVYLLLDDGTPFGVVGNGLTGSNTGYAWKIEEGMIIAHTQENLGEAGIYIDENGTLGLSRYKDENVFSKTIISDISSSSGLNTNVFKNPITSSNGEISIASGSQSEIKGDIDTVGSGNNLRLTFYQYSALVLSGKNNAENFVINFGGKEGGESNYLVTNVNGLATGSINATNLTDDEKGLKEFAFFELVIKEDEDNKVYNGSLQGEMYVHKLGSGTVTLSGNNTYTQGTYISEGGLLLANSNSIGTGNIWFDRGEKGVSSTYASIGVCASSPTTSDIQNIDLVNNIHVKNGAILNVEKNQNLRMLGDLVSYDARPGYETEFIKKGLGEATISGTLDANRQVNISSFNVQDGGFVLDKNIVLNSYFSLNGQGAYLKINEDAGVKNNAIDINSGDLIIFNEKNISSATAVNFYNGTDYFSKLHMTSNTVLSDATMSGKIYVEKNIEFVTDATTTAKMGQFTFNAGNNKIIVSSGTGKFIADAESNGSQGSFVAKELYVNGGIFRIENMNMSVSSQTLVDGGILSISSTSHFASTAASDEDKKITVLDGGGIGIYNAVSIDSHTALNFEGTDENNLARLVIEGDKVELGNNIYVKTGLIIENEKDFTFLGYSDKSTAGILAKAGAGTMTINSKGFTMKEIRALEGNLLVKSNISVSTISVLGDNALLSFENVENAEIKNTLSLSEGGTLAVSTSTLTIDNISLDSATIRNTSSNININKDLTIGASELSLLEENAKISAGGNIDFSSSTIMLLGDSSQIKAANNIGFSSSTINLFAASAQISTEKDVEFGDSIINLSSVAASINATNNALFVNSKINLSTGTFINATTINFTSSTIVFSTSSANLNAQTVNLNESSKLIAFGKINSNLNVGKGSSIKIGKENSIDTLQTKNLVFESGSELYIDVSSENGVVATDILEVSGDITVHKNSTLYVNLMGDDLQYDAASDVSFTAEDEDSAKEFKFLTFSGNYSFDNTTNEIFNIVLSDPRLSASTALIEKSIFLRIAQEWSVYDIPGATKNQDSMIKVFNKIYADDKTKESMKSVLSTLDAIYSTYRTTGNKTQFINALQDLSGIFYANSFMTSAMLSKANIIYSRLNDYSKEREEDNRIWAKVYTNNFSVAENEENPKFENSMYGMIAGYDTVTDENLVFGVAGFYGQGELKQLEDKADVIDAGVNVYGDYKVNENIDVKGLFGYSMQDYDTTRNLRFIKQEIKSKYAANTISVDLEAAYRYDLNEKLSLKPLVGANCAIVSNGDIEEDGNTEQKLKINKNSYTKADVRVGVGLQTRAFSPFNWYISAVVKQIVAGDKFTTKSSFVHASEYEFEIESTKLASTSFSGNIGCSYDINSSFNVSLDLNADSGSASQFGANIGATYRW